MEMYALWIIVVLTHQATLTFHHHTIEDRNKKKKAEPNLVLHCYVASLYKKVESSCCKPKLSNGKQDRVRIIIVRTKSGIQYVKSINMWMIEFNILVL